MVNVNYKLIVSDFDGTLADNDGTISEKNQNAIFEYINSGGIFAISTGRLPAAILPQVRKLGINGFLCCGQGTIILDIESGEIVFDKRLSMEATLSACIKMEEMQLHINAFDLWEYYSNMDDDLLKLYESIAKTKAKLVTERKLSHFLEEKQIPVYKLLAIVKPSDNIRIFKELRDENLPDCDVTKSTDFLVEIVNKNYTKGTSIEFLAKTYGIAMEETIAIGDNYNDISMIEYAGLGIAVKNAEKSLKDRADYVCEFTNEESAIAEVIEKFGFIKE